MTAGAVFEKARREDDPALRRILRETAMPGDIEVAFAREPNYFDALAVQGDQVDVLTLRVNNHIVAIGDRAEKRAYVNGVPSRIGYLSGLRMLPEYRRGTFLARSYHGLYGVHREGNVPYYLSTIVSDNTVARETLTAGRGGLPTYRDFGEYVTLALEPGNGNRSTAQVPVRSASEEDKEPLLQFLRENGPRRQFFPNYESGDFTGGLLQGLRIEDVLLVHENQQIIACLALWDQKSFKQSIITDYSRRMAMMRPCWNLYAGLTGRPQLAPPGTELRYLNLALCCIAEDRANVFWSLLCTAMARAREIDGLHAVMAGFHARDPLLQTAQEWPHRTYSSRLYLVHWDDGATAVDAVDDRVPYLELGAL
jgi:hypothetical protein